MKGTAIALLLLTSPLAAAETALEEVRGPVAARLESDRASLPLSGEVFVTLRVEGPRRVEVDTVPLLLTADSLRAWHVDPADLPLVEVMDDGRQVWSRRFRLRPYLLGPRVPIAVAPISIRAGTLKEFELTWPKPLEVEVTATPDPEDPSPETDPAKLVARADASKLKPGTGVEQVPKGGGAPANPRPQWVVASIVVAGAAAVLIGVYLLVRRTRPTVHPELHDTEWALRELAALKGRDDPAAEILDRVSYILREWVQLYNRVPASRLTTPELLATLSQAGTDPARVRELETILERCDLERFNPGSTSEDVAPLFDRAARFVGHP